MTKGEFMRELERYLSRIPENERKDALEYYSDYFAEAGITDDMLIPGSIGTPKQVADQIINGASGMDNDEFDDTGNHGYYEKDAKTENYGGQSNSGNTSYYNSNDEIRYDSYSSNQRKKNGQDSQDNSRLVLGIILLVVLSPIWISIISAIGGVLFGMFAALVGVIIGFGCAAIALTIVAFWSSSIAGGILLFGTGLIFAALTLVCILLLVMFCGQFLPWLVKEIIKLFQWMFGKKE